MLGQYGICPEPLQRVQLPRQRHLIVFSVDATMTQPANADAGLKRLLREVALEVGPPVDFLWNQVVKGERDRALTAGAALARRLLQLEAAGKAASIAVRISSPFGSSPLEK